MQDSIEGTNSFWITLDPGMEQEFIKDRVAGDEYRAFPGHWFPFSDLSALLEDEESPFYLNIFTEISLEDIYPESVYTNGTAWVFRLKPGPLRDGIRHNGWVCSMPPNTAHLAPHQAWHIFVHSPRTNVPDIQATTALGFLQKLLVNEYFFQFTTESRESMREQIANLKEQIKSGNDIMDSLQEAIDASRMQTDTLHYELAASKSENVENLLLIESAQVELEALATALADTEEKLAKSMADDLEDETEIKNLLYVKRTLVSELEVISNTVKNLELTINNHRIKEKSLVEKLFTAEEKINRKKEETRDAKLLLYQSQLRQNKLEIQLLEKEREKKKMRDWTLFRKFAWIFGI